ncbi:iron-containing alcohol dehydrogenase [Alkalimonas sp.]|uniref:iron-containing alcohol dehydrogenase n=1 Tax=Alkalimonas sp. TaxID=1872453 RepID=UPI00263BDFDC|nr:iron-containing alcohol dehydrogenase [Alkalimonas sp.]MCC5825892.1 iron-containing alcohol dehydrogenase [Alkalimonas sp.]
MLFTLEKIALRLYMMAFKVSTALLPFRWPKVFQGPGSSSLLLQHIQQQETGCLLLVTDTALRQLGLLAPLLAELESLGIHYQVFDQITPDPINAQIEAGYQALVQADASALLAVGGGSVIDAAKLIGARAKNKKSVLKMTGMLRVWRGMLPVYAIPTTAGTGSEVTIAAVVSDPEHQRKLPLIDVRLLPKAAALDAHLMAGLPPAITASTGMDALTHAIEAYLSRNANRTTDQQALAAAQAIFSYLPRAFAHGADLEARQQMAEASHLAGKAFTVAGVGYIHAIAHQLGAYYHVPHGLANAMVMPSVLAFSLPACQKRMAHLARHCQLASGAHSDQQAAQALIDRIIHLNESFGIANKVPQLQASDIAAIARAALAEARFTYAVPRYLNQRSAEQLISQLLPDASAD